MKEEEEGHKISQTLLKYIEQDNKQYVNETNKRKDKKKTEKEFLDALQQQIIATAKQID